MGDTSQTVYITMIRDPVDIFVSAWDYYKLDGNYKMTLRNKLELRLLSNITPCFTQTSLPPLRKM